MYYIVTNGKKYLGHPRLDNAEFCFVSNIYEANIYNDYEYAKNHANTINKRNYHNDFENYFVTEINIKYETYYKIN